MKHKLHDRCSNNQAEQIAIVKTLQAIETIKINKNIPRTIIHTDSRITLDSLKNKKNRNRLVEDIRKKTTTLEKNLDHRMHLDKGTRRTLEMSLLTNLLRRPPEVVTYATTKSQKVK
jgi:ribonuclease HI